VFSTATANYEDFQITPLILTLILLSQLQCFASSSNPNNSLKSLINMASKELFGLYSFAKCDEKTPNDQIFKKLCTAKAGR
jgi:hypothetical protein